MQHRREESVFTCIASPPPPNEQTCLEDYDTNLSLTGQHSPRPLSPVSRSTHRYSSGFLSFLFMLFSTLHVTISGYHCFPFPSFNPPPAWPVRPRHVQGID